MPDGGECEPFNRWLKLRIYAGFVATGINAIPAMVFQINGIKPVQAKWWAFGLYCQALVAQSRWNGVRAQERSQ